MATCPLNTDLDEPVSGSEKADEIIDAKMSQTGAQAHVIRQRQGPSIVVCNKDEAKVIPKGDKVMKTLKKALKNTIPEGEVTGELSILVVGRTGKGKSALINSIIELGKQITKQGAKQESCTKIVQPHVCMDVFNGVNVILVDSPGLQDTQGLEQTYIQQMKEQCPQVNLILYCMKMTDQRLENDDKVAIQKLYQAFGPQFWRRVIFVLTYANNERVDQKDDRDDESEEEEDDDDTLDKKKIMERKLRRFENRVKLRNEETKAFLHKQVGFDKDLVANLSFIPAGYYKKDDLTPDPYQLHGSKNWLYDLLVKCCEEVKLHQFTKLCLNDKIHLAIIIDNSIENAPNEQGKLILNCQAKATKESLQKLGFIVVYFNCLSSYSVNQLLQAFKDVDHSQLAMFALVVLSTKGNSDSICGIANEPLTFEDIFSHFRNVLFEIPKLFFFNLGHDTSAGSNKFKTNVPQNSIALVVFFNDAAATEKCVDRVILSFVNHLGQKNQSLLKQCFEDIRDECSKFKGATCLYLNRLRDNFVLPTFYQPFNNRDKAAFIQKKVSFLRVLWYLVHWKVYDALLESKSEIESIVRDERKQNLFAHTANVVGMGAFIGTVVIFPVTSVIPVVALLAMSLTPFARPVTSLIAYLKSNNFFQLTKTQQLIEIDKQLFDSYCSLLDEYSKAIEALKLKVFISPEAATETTALESVGIAVRAVGRVAGAILKAYPVVNVISVPLDIGYIIYRAVSNSKGGVEGNKKYQSYLKEIEVVLKGFFQMTAQKNFNFDNECVQDSHSSADCQLIEAPEGSPPVTVSTILSGPFQLPENTTLVSAIYDVKIDAVLEDPITLNINHCVDSTNPAKLHFAKAKMNVESKHFKFVVEKGKGIDFLTNKGYGSIELKESCLLCILYIDPEFQLIKYAAQCSYTQESQHTWKMHCTFTKGLDAYVTYACEFGITEVHPFKFTSDNSHDIPCIDLDEFRHDIRSSGPWTISPSIIPNNITQAELNTIELSASDKLLREIIPFMEFDIIRSDEEFSSIELDTTIPVKGTDLKLPFILHTNNSS